VLLGINTSAPCDVSGFTQQLENAHKFKTDAVVRLDLTACQLNLLKSLPLVKGVYPDIPLDHHAVTAPSSTAFNSLNNAMSFSFNSTSSRQVNTTTMGSGSPKTVDGNGVVIALLDPVLRNDTLRWEVQKYYRVLVFRRRVMAGQAFVPTEKTR
jgi:hypothetical protein